MITLSGVDLFGVTVGDVGVVAALVVPLSGGIYTFVAWWRSKGHQERNDDADTLAESIRAVTDSVVTLGTGYIDLFKPLQADLCEQRELLAEQRASGAEQRAELIEVRAAAVTRAEADEIRIGNLERHLEAIRGYIVELHTQIRGLGGTPRPPPSDMSTFTDPQQGE